MKFLAGLAVAASLASSAASAAVASAPVYILSKAQSSSSDSDSTPPSLPRQIARQILLQRLAATEATSFFDTLPRHYDVDAALSLIEQFGGDASSSTNFLASDDALPRHPEMLVVVEGVTDKHVAAIEGALSASPAFTVADPPSQAANAKLFVDELAAGGIVAHKDVALAEALAPSAWINGVFVGLYDVKQNPSVVDEIVKTLPEIVALASSGNADVTVVLMPEGSRASKANVWAHVHKHHKDHKSQNQHDEIKHDKIKHRPSVSGLELRAEESVFIEGDADFDSETTFTKADNTFVESVESVESPETAEFKTNDFVPAAAAGSIPACFQSFNSCDAQTNSCSGHGKCVDKFAFNSGGIATPNAAKGSCFVCHCFSTLNRPEDAEGGLSTTQWAGNKCHKIDVSVPFWLITGFTVAIVGAVAFAIGLLFSVGEEKLPGVIGAGVSRSK